MKGKIQIRWFIFKKKYKSYLRELFVVTNQTNGVVFIDILPELKYLPREYNDLMMFSVIVGIK